MAEKIAAAAAAWKRGRAAAQAGDRPGALPWFERAARLAPNDPRITLELAELRLALGIGDTAAFDLLVRRYDLAAAWQGLIGAHLLARDKAAAAAALGRYLSRHGLPDDFAGIANNIASAGWCGVTAAGALVVSAPEGAAVGVRLDGRKIRLPKKIPNGRRLEITADGAALCGSPLDLTALARIDGVVASGPDGLSGWACRPAFPAGPPDLTLENARGTRIQIGFTGTTLPPDDSAPFLPRHQFTVPRAALKYPPFRLSDSAGAQIFGSPIDPAALQKIQPVPASRRGPTVTRLPRRHPLAVVVPVFRGLAVTRACLDALFSALPPDSEIIVVDDATPEPALARLLDACAVQGRITLLRHHENRGFPAAANAGFRAAGARDVLLLNSDTLLPPGAIVALTAVAYGHPARGSVTPLSNEATICSVPDAAGGNPAPDLAETIRLNALAREANGLGAVEIPTGIGFCMFIRHDCLKATGGFRSDIFAQGYGEENDWCLRARALGYRHAAATGVFVAHLGGVSFGAAGRALNARNDALLNHLHPGYGRLIARFIAADPLAAARTRLDAARFAAGRRPQAVLLISHNHGGGVFRRVAEEMAEISASGRRAILLFPAAPADPLNTPFPWDAQLTDGATADYPNLKFILPDKMPALIETLHKENVTAVILHHALGHHPAVRGIAAALGVPQTLVLHDYASFCPRVNLLTKPSKQAHLRYCGEPDAEGCVACVKRAGDETFEHLGVKKLLRRSAEEFSAASRIIVPSADAARRIARHFPGATPEIVPWEDDTAPFHLAPPRRGGARRIAVIGGIGPQKGLNILLDCAADARARRLDLSFAVAGASAEDAQLLDAGIFVTGEYKEGEAETLVRGLRADLALIPSIWPETWCYTLTEAWRAGLYAVAFDLGAPAARIRATGRGGVLPLGLPAARINDALLAWQPDLRNAPVANETMPKVV